MCLYIYIRIYVYIYIYLYGVYQPSKIGGTGGDSTNENGAIQNIIKTNHSMMIYLGYH